MDVGLLRPRSIIDSRAFCCALNMARRPWDHGGKTRQQRGYGRDHERMRAHLIATVILCEECTRQGRATPGTVADHIKPKAQGGTNERRNYQLLCEPCDKAKQAKDRGFRLKARPTFGEDGWPI